jgi:DNA-binding GntR family transcriptional regulator
MSVSRSPVREALRQLEQEGLVTSTPNQGARVRVFGERDIREIFTLRAALETLACEIAVTNGGVEREELAALERLVEAQLAAVASADFERLTKLDMVFHERICRLAHFERLMRMWRSLRAQMEVLFNQRFRARPDYVPPTVSTDHAQLVEALREKDLGALAQLHRDINIRVARECAEIIWQRSEE